MERALHTGLPCRGEREKIVAAKTNRLGTDREGFQHMGPAVDASVEQYINLVAYGINNLAELVERTS